MRRPPPGPIQTGPQDLPPPSSSAQRLRAATSARDERALRLTEFKAKRKEPEIPEAAATAAVAPLRPELTRGGEEEEGRGATPAPAGLLSRDFFLWCSARPSLMAASGRGVGKEAKEAKRIFKDSLFLYWIPDFPDT